MAIKDEDIFNWFLENPNVDDATIASTMDQFKLTPEDIARATGANLGDVQSRYAAVTPTYTWTGTGGVGGVDTTKVADSTSTGGITDLVTPPAKTTFTDTVKTTPTSDTTTNQVTEWNAPVDLGNGTFMTPGGTIIDKDGYPVTQTATKTDTATKVDTTNPLVALYQSTLGRTPTQEEIDSWGFGDTIDAGELDRFLGAARNEAVTTLPTTGTAAELAQQILAQGKTSLWTGEGFGSTTKNAYDMGVMLAGQGLTDINQLGKELIDVPVYDDEGNQTGTQKATRFINKATGQPINAYYDKASINGPDIWGGTFAGTDSTAYGVKFDAKGNPVFYSKYGGDSSDIGDWGPILSLAAVIPSPIQPFAIAANAAISIDNGDLLGGFASLAGLAGFTDVAAGARILKAAQTGDPFAIVSSILNSPLGGDIGGTMLTDTISLKDAGNAVTIFNSLQNENWAGALTAAGQLTGSSDVATAAAAARFIKAFESNNFAGMYTAASGFNTALNAATKVTDKDVATNIANSVADANSAATAGTQLASLTSDTTSDAGNGLTLTGDGGSKLDFPDLTSSDTINADADLFNSSIGDLDTAGTNTTTNGTDTTGKLDWYDDGTDTGDDVDTLVVTGKGDKTDTTVDTGDTTTNVDDKGTTVITGTKESCPVGTKLNPETGECDPDWDETGVECAPGYHDDGTGLCVLDTDTKETTECAEGMVRDLTTGECVWPKSECEPGFHDDGTGLCVADDDTKKLECAEGYEPNEDGTECIPVIEITDNKCPPGKVRNADGDCVWPEEECAEGYHLENGICVADEDKKVVCDEGFHLSEDGKTCVPDEEKPIVCDDGFHLSEDGKTCVPNTEECAEGFHLENGICVADDDEKCEDGYEKVNGACVPVCAEGYIRNLETGTCEKVEDKGCPPGYHKEGDKCVKDIVTPPTPCPTGYERIGGVCVPIKKVVPPTVPSAVSPSSASGEGEKIDPIYATGMDPFDMFATLQELLAEDSSKKDTKKADKKSKDKTKMATGGHLDDLLAEQMTVDDLLKLLR